MAHVRLHMFFFFLSLRIGIFVRGDIRFGEHGN